MAGIVKAGKWLKFEQNWARVLLQSFQTPKQKPGGVGAHGKEPNNWRSDGAPWEFIISTWVLASGTISGNLCPREPTVVLSLVAAAWRMHLGRGARPLWGGHSVSREVWQWGPTRLCRTMPDLLVWHKEGCPLTLDHQDRPDALRQPLLKMAVESILERWESGETLSSKTYYPLLSCPHSILHTIAGSWQS